MKNPMQAEIHFEPVPFFVYSFQIRRPRELEGRGFFGWLKQENTLIQIFQCAMFLNSFL